MRSGPVATVLPKPILKHQHLAPFERPSSSPPSTHAAERHAHFGASEITQRFSCLSGIEYDRTPIVVCANALDLSSCRRSPGRTFDELDAHYYKHKKAVRYTDEDELIVGAAAALERLNRPIGAPLTESDSLNLPALVHTDTSDSEAEDELLSSSGTDSRRRLCRLRPSSSPPGSGRDPKRLKKAHNSGKLSRTTARDRTSLDDSSFASCPSATSCLGGF
jgi:hypothetical protein